jgi:hypothetical protein
MFLTDEYDNAYVNEDFVSVARVNARVSYSGNEFNLTATKLIANRIDAGTQVYKFVIPNN